MAGAALARYNTLKIGGPADWLVDVASMSALGRLLQWVGEHQEPFHLHGLGSNVLFPDDGLPGVVARLVGEFRRLRFRGEWVSAGAGIPLPQVARKSAQRGLVGLEALSGFPSTVGGGVVMNAGCYGTEIKDVLVAATIVDASGNRHRLGVGDLGAAYRSTVLQGSGSIVTRAVFRLRTGDAAAAVRRIDELNARRWASLPSGLPNAGSIFKNPPGDFAGRLIEATSLKGEVRGGAQISPKHANVIVNTGGASAEDVLRLMVEASRRVRERFSIRLEPEVVLTGPLRARWLEATE